MPGPASTAAGLVSTKSASFSPAGQNVKTFGATCDSGQKAVSGGFTSQGAVLSADSAPTSDGSGWQLLLVNADASAASGTVYAVCLK